MVVTDLLEVDEGDQKWGFHVRNALGQIEGWRLMKEMRSGGVDAGWWQIRRWKKVVVVKGGGGSGRERKRELDVVEREDFV
ncbi:hypothetical protein HanIR_Chr15g0753961 [Helianthus annuus]|nr:hypothetical protein HanIR_Chr15g0753961 [Helianthus annuus]